jgi:hypothetical protein
MERRLLIVGFIALGTVILITLALFFLFRGERSGDGGQNFFGIPFDQGAPSPGVGGEDTDISTDVGSFRDADLVKIADGPIAGAMIRSTLIKVATSTETSGTTTGPQANTYHKEVRYIEKKTGNVYDYDVATASEVRSSNTLIPGVRSVSWISGGERVGIVTSDSDEIYLAHIHDGELEGEFLNRDVLSLVPMGTTSMAKLLDNGSGVLIQETSPLDSPLLDLARSPLRKVSLVEAGKDAVALVSSPAAILLGVGFYVKRNSAPEQIASGEGLTLLPHPGGVWFLVGTSEKKNIALSAYNRETGETVSLPLKTLPEKCVWHPTKPVAYCGVPTSIKTGLYPDDWYQGVVSFEDRIWEIDVQGGKGTLARDFSEEGPFDITNLSIDESGTYLTFINKIDGSLWGLKR